MVDVINQGFGGSNFFTQGYQSRVGVFALTGAGIEPSTIADLVKMDAVIDLIAPSQSYSVYIKGLRDIDDGQVIDNASPTFTLYDSSGTPIVSDQAMTHQGNDPYGNPTGNYRGTLTGQSLTIGSMYHLVISITALEASWIKWFRAQARDFSI